MSWDNKSEKLTIYKRKPDTWLALWLGGWLKHILWAHTWACQYSIIRIGKADCLCEQNSTDGISLSNKILTGEVWMHQIWDRVKSKDSIFLTFTIGILFDNRILENF